MYKEILNPELSTEEKLLKDSVNNVSNTLLSMCRGIIRDASPDIKKLFNRVKENEKEFGYICAEFAAGDICLVMKRFGLNTITDLGCGMGFILKAISYGFVGQEYYVYGYDNEDTLLRVANSFDKHWSNKHEYYFKNKDICLLKDKDIPNKSLIYWWAPMCDNVLINKFLDNIVNIVEPGQIFAILGYGPELEKRGVKYLGSFNILNIYIK